jgi:hypothetical protein
VPEVGDKKMEAKMETNQAKTAKQEEKLFEINVRMNENTKLMNAEMVTNQAEMRSIICIFRSELKETIQAAIQSVRSELDEKTACPKATETEPDPRMMQSKEVPQERRNSNVCRRTEKTA